MQVIEIHPGQSSSHSWRELWRYRELFYFLTWRDFLARYKQTAVGVAWAVIRPLLTTFVFTFVFSKLARLDSGPIPYLLLVLAAQLPWQVFSNAFSSCGVSLQTNSHLVTKIYFPRLLLPLSSLMLGLVDFLITLALFFLFMAAYHYYPTWRILTLPLWITAALVAAFSIGIWFAALNVRYRDFGNIIPFALQIGLYLSPIGYSTQIVPERWRFLYSLNPVVGVVEGFRWAMLGSPFTADPHAIILSWLGTGLLLWTGFRYFHRVEHTFADVI